VKAISSFALFVNLQLALLCSVVGMAQTSYQTSTRIIGTPEVWGRPAPNASEARESDAGPATRTELLEAPEPMLPMGGAEERGHVPWEAKENQQPFSRVGVGADVSPMGIGIKSAVVLSQYFDARALVNFFDYDSGNFELEGFRVDAKLHLASTGAMVDCYPLNSIWRLSAGLMLSNANQLSASTAIVPGTSFQLNNQTFYSAKANAATGATPLAGTGSVAMHRNSPAFMASFGFGKFIPRSNRHWSFPSEFGAVFTGAPTIEVKSGGWVCTDEELSECSNIADPANPVAVQFNSALQTQLTKWRKSLSVVSIYPIFSYSVMYSFNVR
jgi:hypothetical protein